MTKTTDAQLLQELANKTLNDSMFALNINNLPDTVKRLRDTLGYVERLIQARDIQANASDEFAGYSINDPFGKA